MQNQDMAETFTFDLGSERNVKIYEHNTNVEETIIDVRLFDDDEPTEKGQSMTLSRWRILCDSLEIIDKNLEDVKKDKDVDYRLHLGGNVYVSVTSPYRCINIRKFYFMRNVKSGKKTLYPTREGVSLRFPEWAKLKNNLSEINFHLPVELDSVVPCYARQDHSNQMAMLECMECNPSGDIDNDN